MGLRSVQVTSESGRRKRLDHVIGVDESGNPDGGNEPFVISAVQCPRNYGEELAESLVDAGLNPWRSKSSSLSVSDKAKATQDERVRSFIDAISSTPITWCAAVGWEAYSVPRRATIACTVTSKALTTPHSDQLPSFEEMQYSFTMETRKRMEINSVTSENRQVLNSTRRFSLQSVQFAFRRSLRQI